MMGEFVLPCFRRGLEMWSGPWAVFKEMNYEIEFTRGLEGGEHKSGVNGFGVVNG